MENKFTTIRTKNGKFEVVQDGEKYFLKYLEKGKQPKKVGYLINQKDGFWLQEAFFDKCGYPWFSYRRALNVNDMSIRKDLMDNLIAGCYRIEKDINSRRRGKHKITLAGHSKTSWRRIIDSLRNGADITKVDFGILEDE